MRASSSAELPGVPAMMRGAERMVSTNGHSRNAQAPRVNTAVAPRAHSADLRRGVPRSPYSVRPASSATKSAPMGTGYVPPKPSSTAKVPATTAAPRRWPSAARRVPHSSQGSSRKPAKLSQPMDHDSAVKPARPNSGAAPSAPSAEPTRRRA
ncbi:hypothetical protein QEG98_02900 [Myxococcus sp. MxC21-1]|uniref:hypothetical protein n=1 Tax=Myxococcus sp. MxC21-1 TaxID=3041439 RepID=UPI002930D49C|nr:hypothetical protein [Myxococcus sp. MxC21-1]WNZ62784.1 hypothetical protein QEG98_02900 [Myxococcus sp. MxC21-1]